MKGNGFLKIMDFTPPNNFLKVSNIYKKNKIKK